MSKKTEIRGVDGISSKEVAKAMEAKKLYLAVGSRWTSQGGGFIEPCYQVSVTRIRTYRPRAVNFQSPSDEPIDTPLTRAVFYNADRGPGSTFLSAPEIQEVADRLRSLPVPALGEPSAVYVWHRHRGVVARCGR